MDRRDLLSWVDELLEGGPRGWSDVVLVRNVGPLATSSRLDGDNISNRGFNALLLGKDRAPTHFLKFRAVDHAAFRREAQFTVALSAHPSTKGMVPFAQAFENDRVRVLAEKFVDGQGLEAVIRKRPKEWARFAADAIRSAGPLWSAIAQVAAQLTEPGVKASVPADDLLLLQSIGLDPAISRRLEGYLESSTLPASPQHGDFWPRNVLSTAAGLTVLDFENCGDVVVPLYDAFHMIRGCAHAASRGAVNWVELWSTGPDARCLAEAIRAASRGLDAHAETALVSYMVECAARLYRRGNVRERLAGRLRELNALPDLLERGVLRALLE